MRELPITTRTIHKEDNQPLTLQYIILVEERTDGLEHYGVKITEESTAASTSASDLTMSLQKIYDLIETLANGSVTPTGLMDVLADWP